MLIAYTKRKLSHSRPCRLILISAVVLFCSQISLFSQPVIEVEPLELDFGEVEVDSSESRWITITNNGDEPLLVESITSDSEIFTTIDFSDPDHGDPGIEHFDVVVRTSVSHSFLVVDSYWDGGLLATGVEIGIFTPGGLCVGAKEVVDVGESVGFGAWENEREEDEEPNGFRNGEEFSFRLWDHSYDLEVNAEYEVIEGAGNFRGNGFTVVALNAEGGNHRIGNGVIALESEGVFTTPICFNPVEQIRYEADLIIISNDPEHPELIVELSGGSINDVNSPRTNYPANVPDRFVLLPAYPNPFNNSTSIEFGIPASGSVNLSLLNMRGESVKDLFTDRHFSAGFHEIELEMGEFPAGCYLMRLEFGRKVLTQSVVLMK